MGTNLFRKDNWKLFFDDLHDYIISECDDGNFGDKQMDKLSKVMSKGFTYAKRELKEKKIESSGLIK